MNPQRDNTQASPAGGAATLRRPQDVTVLVVDDDPDVTTYLASVLEDAGMKVVTAADGLSAMERIHEAMPDLISLDLVMPGKSGIRLLHELRKHPDWSRIPVIIVTGHARDDTIREDLAAVLENSTISGPSLYLEKPVTPALYVEQICRVLNVEPPIETAPLPDRTEALRRELEAALRGADRHTLEKVLAALQSAGEDENEAR
jgi:CheY-like chemotaxis protein